MRKDRAPRPPALAASTLTLALALALLAGCGGDDPNVAVPTPPTGPHGGVLATLSDGRGHGEILIETESGARAGLRARVVAFFLRDDLSGPLDPLPTEVRVKLALPDSPEPVDIPLRPEPEPKAAPAGSARFRSEPGDYAIDQYFGTLTGNLAGAPFSADFAGR